MKEICRLHGVPKVIVSDRDTKITGNFWKDLFKGLGTQLNFNSTYHWKMDGHTKRVNRVLEDMLRMHVMDKPGKWEEYLHLVEFAYNNNFQLSTDMIPFEILYGHKYTPISWNSLVHILMLGPDLLKDMELIMKQVQ